MRLSADGFEGPFPFSLSLSEHDQASNCWRSRDFLLDSDGERIELHLDIRVEFLPVISVRD